VLGKGVPERVLAEVVERAAAAGCDTVRLSYRDTGVNRAATGFLATLGERTSAAGRRLRVVAEAAVPA
jgi:predicted enzyme involved in methoxymalonyl-ACP biosynthesis